MDSKRELSEKKIKEIEDRKVRAKELKKNAPTLEQILERKLQRERNRATSSK